MDTLWTDLKSRALHYFSVVAQNDADDQPLTADYDFPVYQHYGQGNYVMEGRSRVTRQHADAAPALQQ